MDRFRKNLQKHPSVAWTLLLGYLAFNGCFIFPFSNELFPLDFQKGLMVVCCYGLIGLCFAGLLVKGKSHLVFLLSLLFTAVGLALRYWLEYGEVSNTMNFIPVNIILFLAVVPLYCTAVYWGIYRTSKDAEPS